MINDQSYYNIDNEHRTVCDASITEQILYYLVFPEELFRKIKSYFVAILG
jgi:hypothetical protein